MDRERFAELATAEWRAVYRFARRLTRDQHEAEDLVQDVFAQAFQPERIEAFEPRGGGLRAWLLRITYRRFLSRVERRAREGRGAEAHAPETAAPTEVVAAARVADFDWEDVDSRLRDAVARLDDGARQVLLLWSVEELQYHEIAEVLDIPIGTVMSRLHRARTKVSAMLLSDSDAVEELGLRGEQSTAPRGAQGAR